MKIENIQINDLKPYALNAKSHPEKQIEGLTESIKRFGFTQPVVVDKNNEIIIGHGRLEAAKKAGLTEIPCLKKENLNEVEVKALRLIDNRIAETGWDIEFLNEDLQMIDYDFEVFNISFDELINESFAAANKEIDFDDLEDEIEIKFKFQKEDFDFINQYFQSQNMTKEQALYKLIQNAL